ncbi:MAG: DUF721 domain-containing protein [Armatimonadetes bacterium]|nr:DUF721 domain-containing protein [Armatimonadota bacterium]
MVVPIRDVLRSAARALGIEPAAHLAAAREAWPRVVGQALAGVSAPVTLRGKRLQVGVTHEAAGQEIRLRRAEIVVALAREVGEGAITDVTPVARRSLPGRGPGRREVR